MGLFDFFKRKEETNNNVSSNKIDEAKPVLSLEERYGAASLKGFKENNWDEAVSEFANLESEGFSEASIALGQIAQMNDKEKALVHFKKAASQNDAEALWSCAAIIGHAYVPDVNGADKDWFAYCLNSAQNGCCDAMNELGNMYNRQDNYLGAFYWYQMAAYYEHPQGYAAVAGTVKKWVEAGTPELATEVFGIRPNDIKNSVSIMRCMARLDDLDNDRMQAFMTAAMEDDNEIMGLFIGHFFEDAVNMPANSKMGYQLAAHNNSIMGMKCLADMQAYGKGCEQNMQNALGWYQGAAEKREKTACFVMGEMYRQQNRLLAAYWYSVSYRRGYQPALQRLMQL